MGQQRKMEIDSAGCCWPCSGPVGQVLLQRLSEPLNAGGEFAPQRMRWDEERSSGKAQAAECASPGPA